MPRFSARGDLPRPRHARHRQCLAKGSYRLEGPNVPAAGFVTFVTVCFHVTPPSMVVHTASMVQEKKKPVFGVTNCGVADWNMPFPVVPLGGLVTATWFHRAPASAVTKNVPCDCTSHLLVLKNMWIPLNTFGVGTEFHGRPASWLV